MERTNKTVSNQCNDSTSDKANIEHNKMDSIEDMESGEMKMATQSLGHSPLTASDTVTLSECLATMPNMDKSNSMDSACDSLKSQSLI